MELPSWIEPIREAILPGSCIYVGFSGGLDSTTLLEIYHQLSVQRTVNLRAVHIHHGLSQLADDWALHCYQFCIARKIPLEIYRVQVQPLAQKSLEAAARTARYQIFSQLSGDVLALAHHQDDQAETLLYRLTRGTGLEGLGGMPTRRNLSPKLQLFRPLLNVSRHQLRDFAQTQGLSWVEDPMNEDPHYARTILRQEIMPHLRRINTKASAHLQTAAAHCQEASKLLDELALLDWGIAGAMPSNVREDNNLPSLALDILQTLSEPRARNLLRFFLKCHNVQISSREQLQEWLRQLLQAKIDQNIRLNNPEATFGVYRGQLYRLPLLGKIPVRQWRGEPRFYLPHGILQSTKTMGQGFALHWLEKQTFWVGPRRGGEKICLGLDRPHRALKDLWQSQGIPPWQRASTPLLFLDSESDHRLVAVPNLGVDFSFQARGNEIGLVIRWLPALSPYAADLAGNNFSTIDTIPDSASTK